MSFASDEGYVPVSFRTMMEAIMVGLNTQFNTGYTYETFEASNHYKYFYVLVQRALENENKTAEIFAKLQAYIVTTNERIQRPSVSNPGLIDTFANQAQTFDKPYIVSVKATEEADAGTVSVAVLVDDSSPTYISEDKGNIARILNETIVAGMVTTGAESQNILLSNGQSFTYRWHLPNYIPTALRITVNISDNHPATVPDDEQIRNQLITNIAARYRLGWDFEPQRYYTQSDAPWASSIVLEYDIGGAFETEVYEANFDDLLTFDLEEIEVVYV